MWKGDLSYSGGTKWISIDKTPFNDTEIPLIKLQSPDLITFLIKKFFIKQLKDQCVLNREKRIYEFENELISF